MRVILKDYDQIDQITTPLLERDGLDLEKLSLFTNGPDHDVLEALLQIQARTESGVEMIAIVTAIHLEGHGARQLDNSRRGYDFTGRKSRKKIGDWCIMNWLVHLHLASPKAEVYFKNIDLQKLWKLFQEKPGTTFKKLISEQIRSEFSTKMDHTNAEVVQRLDEIDSLRKSGKLYGEFLNVVK